MTNEHTADFCKFLKRALKFKVKDGGFTDPNQRTVEVFLADEKITEFSFDVVQKREYEG